MCEWDVPGLGCLKRWDEDVEDLGMVLCLDDLFEICAKLPAIQKREEIRIYTWVSYSKVTYMH